MINEGIYDVACVPQLD